MILPPLAPPEVSDDERARAIMARMVARYGAPPGRITAAPTPGSVPNGPAMRRSVGATSSRPTLRRDRRQSRVDHAVEIDLL